MFDCDQCDKTYQWKDSLVSHNINIHASNALLTKKRKYLDESESNEPYPPLERSNNDGWKLKQVPGFAREESLQRSDAVPDHNTVSRRNIFGHQALATRSQPFKFKHPFCMMVAGPSQSGKTQWVVRLLKERRERIEPPVDGVLLLSLARKLR